MSGDARDNEEINQTGRLVLPSLVLSRFTTQPPAILSGLLLIDIGVTFGSSVGVMGQIRALSAIVSFVFALLMGALSVRFRHKSLLVGGLILYVVSAIGCAFAPNFSSMIVAYSLSGMGLGMVLPMVTTLVAAYFSLEGRARALGWIQGATALSFVIGSPTIGFIAGLWGWRMAFLGFVLPISFLSVLLVTRGLPSAVGGQQGGSSEGRYFAGFRAVFSKSSAVACLVGEVLRLSMFMVFYIYGVSYLRQRFMLSTGFASIAFTIVALCYSVGAFFSGRFVAKFGRKPATVLAIFISGVLTISFTLMPNLWLAMIIYLVGCFFSGMNSPAALGLCLEQVPEYRGAMMSMSAAAINMGEAVGAGIGGLLLLLFGYQVLGISLGAIGIAAATIYHLLTTDPTRT